LLHVEAKKALKGHLERILNNCKVNEGVIDFDDDIYRDIYSYVNETKKHKKVWMRDIDILGVLYKQVSNYLSEHIKNYWETSGELKNIIGNKTIKSLCSRIISYLESIPRDYFVFFELPYVRGIGVKEISLTNNISFIEVINDNDFSEVSVPYNISIPRTGALAMGLLGSPHGYKLKKGRLYVRIQADGYADGTLESSAIKKAYSRFKQVIFLSKLSGVLTEGNVKTSSSRFPDTTPQVYAIYAKEPSTEKYGFNLPETVYGYISRLSINEDSLKPTKLEIFAESFENKESLTPKDKAKILKNRLHYPIKLLQTSEDDKITEPIKTAIEWALDSLTNDNNTFAFLQACIGLEAILGDNNTREKLTETLADRCAYLLGNSIHTRREIRKKFVKLYRSRSKLIHGRKAILGNEELGLLRYAQNILSRIILKEISYI